MPLPELLITSPTEGLLYEDDIAPTFDGQGFTATWKSKALAPRSIDLPKQWRHFFVWVNQGDGQLIAELQLEEGLQRIISSFDLTAVAPSRYGTATYGDSVYSPPSALIRLERSLPREAVSRILEIYLEVRVPDTASAWPIKIIANELTYRALPNIRLRGGNQ